jgi:predicted GNAT family acetyltransferase
VRDEPRHNLILGIADTLTTRPDVHPEQWFWIVREGRDVVACALRTPPYNLVLAQPRDDEALQVLAESIDVELPGVVGNVPEVDLFAELWDATPRVVREQGVYALHRVADLPQAPGRSREATLDDYDLVADWFEAFIVEALPEEDPGRTGLHAQVRSRLDAEGAGFTLWEDGGAAVSLSGYGGNTPNGIRIGPVYTPPEHRGHGYATSLVAEQSARLLREGRRFCFLYTDLANPTSNAIYERIGYERVCASRQIAFE